jgi:hypothetical protein
VEDSFLEWLRARTANSFVAQLDPYADGTLDETGQEQWLRTLRQEREFLQLQLRKSIEQASRLPADPTVRESVLTTLIDRDLKLHPWSAIIAELIAICELALEDGATIRLLGD